MGACLAALFRGEETEYAEAGALALADGIQELRILSFAMTGRKR